jgi:transglutaminase-like putative cysteine protease
VEKCKSPGEAAVLLNREIFKALGVQYHATKRPKPDQSPYESTAAGYASCTGLSVLLVDACRAVGVPARIAGTAQWTGEPGNHTWVEVWDNGWHFIGAAEDGELDRTWFNDRARAADPSRRETRIYATSFKPTGDSFPMVWAPRNTSVPAVDVTARYRDLPAGG